MNNRGFDKLYYASPLITALQTIVLWLMRLQIESLIRWIKQEKLFPVDGVPPKNFLNLPTKYACYDEGSAILPVIKDLD